MKKILISALAVSTLVAGAASVAGAVANSAPTGKVTICHATGSVTNPSVRINTSVNSLQGHGTLANIEAYNGAEDLVNVTADFNLATGHTDDIIYTDNSNVVDCPGPKGDKGDKGDRGNDGAPGLNGHDGSNGVDGKDGAPGLKGDKGDKGDRGNDGTNGQDGAPGLKGDKGDHGDKGDKGDNGENGKDGAPGLDGLTPTILCAPGQGLSFTFDDEFVDSDDLYVLEAGEICPLVGPAGADGTDGVDGSDGADGATGPAGPAGVAGVSGKDGLSTVMTVNQAAPFTDVSPVPAAPTSLPRTGAATTLLLLAAGVLILLGGGFTLYSRLSRQS